MNQSSRPRHIASVGYLRVGRDYGSSQADREIVRLRDGILEGSGSCSTDTQLASNRPDRKGRQEGDLTLRVVPDFFGSAFFCVFFAAFGRLLGRLGRLGPLRSFVGFSGSLGACDAYVFVAAFGGFLRVPWPLFGHPVLLLIVRSFHCPPGTRTSRTNHRPEPRPFLFVLANVCVSIKAVDDLPVRVNLYLLLPTVLPAGEDAGTKSNDT